ncbi:MAG: RlmE family RNA methyltransferase [Patescibacteria group bacterium]|nr:RlmE family RNA methyltransferase [Patescibacteria group bacterium]
MAPRKKGRSRRSNPKKTEAHYKVQDPYFKQAKAHGYRARSAYKLKDILRKYPIVRRGDKVLDLGAAPGSFLQVLNEIGAEAVGMDLKEIEPIEGVSTIVADIFDYKPKGKFDVVTSDLMPNTTGIKFLDNEESVDLELRALQVAKKCLRDDGNAVFKIFNSNELKRFTNNARDCFREVHVFKPDAVRSTSKEIYVVCIGFKC